MSWMELKAIASGEKASTLRKFDDCAAGAPLVWGALQAKYLFRRQWDSAQDHLKGIWALPVLPRHHRAMLAMTADGAVIEQTDFSKAAADIRNWLKDFPSPEGHWRDVADLLDSPPSCSAIGFHLVSNRDDPWAPGSAVWDQRWSIYEILPKHYPNDTGRPHR